MKIKKTFIFYVSTILRPYNISVKFIKFKYKQIILMKENCRHKEINKVIHVYPNMYTLFLNLILEIKLRLK